MGVQVAGGERIWFDTSQAAERVGLHRDTVLKALEAGGLHGGQPKVRGRWRVHRDCLDAWVLGAPCPHQEQRQAVRSA